MRDSTRLCRLVCGRWTKWMVLAVWLVLAVLTGPLGGKLHDAERNDPAGYLPGSAESTKVLELQRRFQKADTMPAVVLYERGSGIVPADRDKTAADAKAFAAIPGVTATVIGPIPAKDGKALQTIVPIVVGATGWDSVGAVAEQVRALATTGDPGLTVHITGPGGIAADSAASFKGVDTTLLLFTVGVVVLILLVTYRSPTLWLLPVLTAGMALTTAQAAIYLLARHASLTVNGQSSGILRVLVFGAATDYALLIVARYREELRRHADRHEAMAQALRQAAPAIIASAATVAIGMSCFLVAKMNSTRGLGPVAAVGIVAGLVSAVTVLPALLVIFGRWMFWPAKPRFAAVAVGGAGAAGAGAPGGGKGWARIGRAIAVRPRVVWLGTAAVLGAMTFGVTGLKANGLSTEDSFTKKPDSVVGAMVLAAHYPAGQGQPVVVVGRAPAATELRSALASVAGVTDVTQPVVVGDLVHVEGTLVDQFESARAEATVDRVRAAVHRVCGAEGLVGGATAVNVDARRAAVSDRSRIIPLVLLVVLVVLVMLLRAVVAPLILMATVVLSFGAALGLSAVVFNHVFHFRGADTSFPLFIFVFLVALGVDYNIFLMTRVREESGRYGTRPAAVVGLAATGGVITSAGVVLAGTFATLATLSVTFLTELGFAVACGVLLDTIVVRAVLVTALTLDLGPTIWWPGGLAHPYSARHSTTKR